MCNTAIQLNININLKLGVMASTRKKLLGKAFFNTIDNKKKVSTFILNLTYPCQYKTHFDKSNMSCFYFIKNSWVVSRCPKNGDIDGS
jgi:hypothetical protein